MSGSQSLSQPFVRLSNIQKYTPMLSGDDVMRKMLEPQTSQSTQATQKTSFFESWSSSGQKFEAADIEKLKQISAQVLTTVFHTMTTNAATTKEILETIYDQCNKFVIENGAPLDKQVDYKESIIAYISQYIKFVHEDYKIVTDFNGSGPPTSTLLSDTNFCIKKLMPQKKDVTINSKPFKYFKHQEQFGLIAYDKDLERNEEVTLFTDSTLKRDKIFTVKNVVESKLKENIGDKTRGDVDAEGNITLSYLNKVDSSGQLQMGKDNTSLSYILMNNPQIRTGTKNSLEIATFLNNLSTFELSKCYPYLDVKFLLPEFVTTKSSKIYKTASVTSFLKGSPISDDAIGQTYKVLEASYIKEDAKTLDKIIRQPAVETNLSAFTMPQTAVNFDETFVGHQESYSDSENQIVKASSGIFERNNIVHDYTKPFLTIKSFNVDIAPTAGLMSFKTGRLSMTLHDKTRMADIAPFIKPDLFGSFGAEIAIQYGWSHMDAMSNMKKTLEETFKFGKDTNYFAEFLDTNKIYEKYIVTNSSYSIDANGQVNIDLSIAMKGPIEIRSITFETDQPKLIGTKQVERRANRLINQINQLAGINKNGKPDKSKAIKGFTFGIGQITSKVQAVVSEFNANTDPKKKGKLQTISTILKVHGQVREKWRSSKGNTSKTRLFYTLYVIQQLIGNGAIQYKNEAGKIVNVGSLEGNLQEKAALFAGEESATKKTAKAATATATTSTPATSTPATAPAAAPAKSTTLLSSTVPDSDIAKLNSWYNSFIRLVNSANNAVSRSRRDLNQTIKTLLTKFTGGLSVEDPFFDKQNFSDIEMIKDKSVKAEFELESKLYCTTIKGIDIAPSGNKNLTKYVSLGNFILALLGSHTAYTGKFDEIQIISYTLNSHAGLAANSNISSLLIDKEQLESFIYELFSNGAQYTLESLFMQIVKKFVTTRFCVNYGLSDFYTLDENNNVVPKGEKKPSEFEVNVNERIQKIHEYRQKRYSGSASLVRNIKFVMPKIKFLFDSMTRESGEITVLRISVIDQNDNPFQSTQQILTNISENGLQSAIYDINKRFIELKSKAKEGVRDIDKQKHEYIQKNEEVFKMLEREGIIVKSPKGEYVLKSSINEGDLSVGIKNNLKTMMPSITYGTNNSAVLEASVSTINEAKLNTVYITRPNRNSAPIKSKVKYAQDLPLRILPSQVNVTIFGCPFINFAQYLFLDFETNTTVDNQYIVTGLKHDITPGKFTTTLTLAYGDAYGKYETIVDTLNRVQKEIETGEVVTDKTVITKEGVSVIADVKTEYDLTNSLKIEKLFPKLSEADEKALGWHSADSISMEGIQGNVNESKMQSAIFVGIDQPIELMGHRTSEKDLFSYKMTIEEELMSYYPGSAMAFTPDPEPDEAFTSSEPETDQKILYDYYRYVIFLDNMKYFYSTIQNNNNNFYIIDITEKITKQFPNQDTDIDSRQIDLEYNFYKSQFFTKKSMRVLGEWSYDFNYPKIDTSSGGMKEATFAEPGRPSVTFKYRDINLERPDILVLLDLNGNEIKFTPKVITTHFKEGDNLVSRDTDKDKIIFDFFINNLEFFYDLQILMNRKYIVLSYKDDVKKLNFNIEKFLDVIKKDPEQSVYNKLSLLVNNKIDKNLTYAIETEKKKKRKKDKGGFNLKSIDLDFKNNKIDLSFKSKNKVYVTKKGKIHIEVGFSIDLKKFVIED